MLERTQKTCLNALLLLPGWPREPKPDARTALRNPVRQREQPAQRHGEIRRSGQCRDQGPDQDPGLHRQPDRRHSAIDDRDAAWHIDMAYLGISNGASLSADRSCR